MNLIKDKKGFTLIEVMVSVSLFAMVMLIATSAVFTIVEANKKTHSLKSVMTNLNFALESMSRDIRFGNYYSCDGVDCNDGSDNFSFKNISGINTGYSFKEEDDYGYIERNVGGILQSITAEEIDIISMKFYLVELGGNSKPRVTIVLKGYAGNLNNRSEFIIQTTVSQWRENPAI